VRTPVCDMLGIEQPIVQAPMAAIPQLAAAVSNAGALGMVTLTWSEDAGAVVRETAALTARPFGGNLVLTEDHHRRLEAALEAGLRIVSFMWGDPSGYIEPVHDAGGVVLLTVGSAEEARRAVASGVDVIVAQGWVARFSAPRAPQLNGQGVGGRGPSPARTAARSGRRDRALRLRRSNRPLRAGAADGRDHR
jgi:nitronate monooxygenase